MPKRWFVFRFSDGTMYFIRLHGSMLTLLHNIRIRHNFAIICVFDINVIIICRSRRNHIGSYHKRHKDYYGNDVKNRFSRCCCFVLHNLIDIISLIVKITISSPVLVVRILSFISNLLSSTLSLLHVSPLFINNVISSLSLLLLVIIAIVVSNNFGEIVVIQQQNIF